VLAPAKSIRNIYYLLEIVNRASLSNHMIEMSIPVYQGWFLKMKYETRKANIIWVTFRETSGDKWSHGYLFGSESLYICWTS